ncbi:MAG: hypothetical protein LLG93_09220 [Deltaproteobacteria bacterium]|nr:hypothetical protein [Deltaproteobacteria bacterium]
MADKQRETGGELVEKNIRTYQTLLKGSVDIHLESFVETHLEMEPTLHPLAESSQIDITAFLYAAIRLPDCIHQVRRVLLGQSEEVFKEAGIADIFDWREVTANARRRQTLFDGRSTLAAFVTSISDVDDILPSLVVFQIEWNKMHALLAASSLGPELAQGRQPASGADEQIRQLLRINEEDWQLIHRGWGTDWDAKLRAIASEPKGMRITLIKGGFSEYRRVVQQWWTELSQHFEETLLEFRPIYLTSSNMTAFSDLLCGFVPAQRDAILEFALDTKLDGFEDRWRRARDDRDELGMADLLYHATRDYLKGSEAAARRYAEMEAEAGILNFNRRQTLDLPAQVIDLRSLPPERMDPRLRVRKIEALRESRAMIVNIEYPLGFAAYHVFSQIAASARKILGVYILGKAATMSARIGDIMIPNEVFDLHSKNTIYFKNCFSLKDFQELTRNVAVLDRQKALTVRGTFLQNKTMMQEYHQEHFNSVEMEAGPYLCAVYEHLYPERYPMSATLNLDNEAETLYDLGLIYYASDTPYHRRESLLSRSMGISGVESVYACSAAVLMKIFSREIRSVLEA